MAEGHYPRGRRPREIITWPKARASRRLAIRVSDETLLRVESAKQTRRRKELSQRRDLLTSRRLGRRRRLFEGGPEGADRDPFYFAKQNVKVSEISKKSRSAEDKEIV